MLRNEICEFFHQEDGVGVIEIVLILVVLIGLVIIFKSQITELLNNILEAASLSLQAHTMFQ